jgi:hypothetical protein
VDPVARVLYGNGGGLTAKRSALSSVTAVRHALRDRRPASHPPRHRQRAFVTQTNPVLLTLDFGAAPCRG